MTDKKHWISYCLLILMPGFFLSLMAAQESTQKPLRLALQWLPQSQFAGYYMALEKGIFRDAGLDISLLHAGPGPSSLDYLMGGQADFATAFLADVMAGGREPVPVVQIAQIVQRSNLMLVAWKDMDIAEPDDLDGKKINFWPGAFSMAFNAFFQRHGIRPIERTQNYSVNLFLRRGVVACAAMEYNELHKLYQAGIDYEQLTIFLMRDYELGFPEDGLYVTADFIRNNTQLCRAFRRAVIAGWDYARQHRQETLDVVLRESRQAGVPANLAHSRWMLDIILLSIFPQEESGHPGRLDQKAYQMVAERLQKSKLLGSILPFELFAPLEEE